MDKITLKACQTVQNVILSDSKNLEMINSESVDLIVTSPPYPMIEMWDELFIKQIPVIKDFFEQGKGFESFKLMHQELDKVWTECFRVLKQGGLLCLNIGDATRNVNKDFQLFSNHSRILSTLIELGFQILPEILWRKQTNAPNKFMGSGMLPAGAYVTLEHEYILIARKGSKRIFSEEEKVIRQESGYFWEERNIWFSDIWDTFKGTLQKMKSDKTRERSAAFPFELAYRLVNMYSMKGDVVLDPFVGTGTTLLATTASERNGIGVEIDPMFQEIIKERLLTEKDTLNCYIEERLEEHLKFIEKRSEQEKELKYTNTAHKFQVMTKQEERIQVKKIQSIKQQSESQFTVEYV